MKTLFILLLLLLCLLVRAQRNPMDRTVTIQVQQQSIESVLRQLNRNYGVSFSYSSSLVPVDKKVSINLKARPLREVLEALLIANGIAYQQVGKQIVLKRMLILPSSTYYPQVSPMVSLSEYIPEQDYLKNDFNEQVQMVSSATDSPSVASSDTIRTVFDRNQLRRRYLAEKIKLKKEYELLRDSLNKVLKEPEPWATDLRNAMETLDIEFLKLQQNIRNIFWPSSDSLSKGSDSLSTLVKPMQKSDSLAQGNTRIAPFQFGIWHGLSTNGPEAARTINHFSLSLFTGRSAGVIGVEASTIFNENLGSVEGVQASGLVNSSKGNIRGLQGAGLMNVAGKELKGVQAAGLINVIEEGSITGVQAAGILNVGSGNARGAQFSGIVNLNDGYLEGFQSAGILNVNQGYLRGAQAAGIVNLQHDHGRGAQFAGVVNVTEGNWVGGTFAGISNVQRGDIEGIQASAIFNQAHKVKGTQLGLINIADTIDGVQIGLVNIARGNGYRRIELAGHEVMQARLSFKLGTERLYTIYQIGWHWGKEEALGIGAGWGTQWKHKNKLKSSLELVCLYVNREQNAFSRLHLLNTLQYQWVIPVGQRLAIQAGPTLQVEVSERSKPEQSFYRLAPGHDWVYDRSFNTSSWAVWPGFKIGISL